MQRRSVLFISSTPPIPRDYGNRNRVFQTIGFFKKLNFDVSLLLYPFDDDWLKQVPPYYRELVDMCDYFAVVPNGRRLHQRAEGDHHQIDEWWDDNIGQQLEWLFARKKFNVLFVNYTFFSKAFEYAPKGVLGVLDTHDIFSGRRETFGRNGVEPEFFYTTPAQEAIAFNRAACVIAIKPSEEQFIRSLTDKAVVSLTYWDATVGADQSRRKSADLEFSHERPLILGFIGALNSVNSVNMTRFLTLFERYVLLYNLPVQVVVAGNVCKKLPDFSFLKKLGRIPLVDEFYQNIDAVIAPLEFSTGIKIKVGEALAWGLPVLATDNAFDGFKHYHFTQAQPSMSALCESIADIATNQMSMKHLRLAAGRAAAAAAKSQERGFMRLRSFIAENTRRIVVFTTRPFWYRATFIDEQIAQMVEYLSAIERVVVVIDQDEAPNVDALHCQVEWESAAASELAALLTELGRHSKIVGFIQCDGRDGLLDEAAMALAANAWILRFAPERDGRFGAPRLTPMTGACNAIELPVSTCRYLPQRSGRPFDPTRVAIYASRQPTEWEQIAIDCARILCEERKLVSIKTLVPPYFEYQREFYDAVLDESAARSILIGPRGWEYAVGQISDYRGGATLFVTEDYIVPEQLDDDGCPSLSAAMSQFLDKHVSASMFGGPNAGWDDVWGVLAKQ